MIHHVTYAIALAELENCLSFYRLLGFQPVDVPAGIAGRAVWLERSGTQIHLMPSAEAAPAQGPHRRGHVGIVVEHYEATLERLRGEGFQIDPRQAHWGSPRCYVRDPAGNLVELMAWPPPESGRAG